MDKDAGRFRLQSHLLALVLFGAVFVGALLVLHAPATLFGYQSPAVDVTEARIEGFGESDLVSLEADDVQAIRETIGDLVVFGPPTPAERLAFDGGGQSILHLTRQDGAELILWTIPAADPYLVISEEGSAVAWHITPESLDALELLYSNLEARYLPA